MNFPSFGSFFKAAPELLIAFNIGGTFDIPTGQFIKGKHGEHILCGGLSHITAVGAKPNAYKTTTAMYMALSAAGRYTSQAILQDTENIFDLSRMNQITRAMEEWRNCYPSDMDNIILIDGNTKIGAWFDTVKKFAAEKMKHEKQLTGTTPFLNKRGENIRMVYPTFVAQDSLSSVGVKEVEEVYGKVEAGDSKTNMVAMTTARIKSQVLVQLPSFTSDNSMFMIFTAQLGTKHQLDPMKPNSKDLSFMKQNEKFKHVPEQFNFLMNNLYQFNPATPLYNSSSDKTPKFPKGKEDRFNQNTDLQEIMGINVRSKKGVSGIPFSILASQTEGLLPTLTEFFYCKTHGDWGIEGNQQTYAFSLMPDMKIQRTTIRRQIEESARLRRAINITSELAQMAHLWFDDRVKHLIPAKDLYEKIQARGYNWDFLLDHTRGYWVFEEQESTNDKWFLSSMDLLLMAEGLYHPYWMDEKDFTKIKPEYAKSHVVFELAKAA